MNINFSEQRELADYVAHKLEAIGVVSAANEKNVAYVIWFAIEDYVGSDENGPDILELAKAHMENA